MLSEIKVMKPSNITTIKSQRLPKVTDCTAGAIFDSRYLLGQMQLEHINNYLLVLICHSEQEEKSGGGD